MPVYRPTVTLGFRVASVTLIVADPGCVNDGREQLRAIYYAKKAGRYLEIHEGHPRYCSDTAIDAPVIGRPKVGARRAELYDLCARRDCTGTFGSFALEWCARGTTITLLGVDARSSDLLRIARGMRPADTAAARPCVPPSR